MKTIKLLLIIIFATFGAQAQIIKPLEGEKWPEKDVQSNFYTVKGYRHGLSYFPKVRYFHVEYEPSENLTFDKYHTVDVIYHWMEKYAEKYPDLIDVYQVGTSFEGRPIVQMTLTNKKTGAATEKPAAYFEGGRHSGEILTCESVMWLMKYLVENYGNDPDITAVLDKSAIYLRPVNNPDGHNLYTHTAQHNRSTVRPMDNDGDGLIDEDGPEDLDGDGLILKMRVKDSKKGNYIIDPADPSKRSMKRVDTGKGDYILIEEGIDNDGDGKFNEDGIGGIDLHRNYLMNWRPIKEETGRGWAQIRPGEFPLSEPETRSVVMFLLQNPNVSIVNSMDTNVNVHLHGPSTTPQSSMFPEDSRWYDYFDSLGLSITGYKAAMQAYNKGFFGGGPRFGIGHDFGYWFYGAIWYGDELYDAGKAPKDYNGDGKINDLDLLIWDDTENSGMGFTEWRPFKHPQLGDIEIGGWDMKFMRLNPPGKHMEPWAKKQALFNFAMTQHLPQLQWEGIEVTKMEGGNEEYTDYEVKISYKNVGGIPTALRQADLVKIVRPDQIRVVLSRDVVFGKPVKARFLPGEEKLPGTPKDLYTVAIRDAGYTQPGEVNSQSVVIRVFGKHTIEGEAFVQTTRAGILPPRKFIIK